MTSRSRSRLLMSALFVWMASLVLVQAASAQTYISAEPVPTGDVIREGNLTKLLSVGYSNLELWSNRLLEECRVVDKVIFFLSADGAIRTVNRGNTDVEVAAGGFEAQTNPTFVFTLKDSGRNAVSAADVGVLDNAIGYVLSQGGTVHFSPNNPDAFDFPLDYAVVSLARHLSGLQAKAFFDFVGTVDPALWSGALAGFTQIGNSMLFLQPDVSKRQFVSGLSTAARRYPWATYETLDRQGRPTTATAGVAFPGNDWVQFPNGDQYLANLGNPSPRLLSALASLRQLHLVAVANLLNAIDRGIVSRYLNHQFRCPELD